MADVGTEQATDGSRLRERPSAKPLHLEKSDDARERVLKLNEEEDSKDGKEKKTFGRTPEGTGMLPYAFTRKP